MYAYKEKLKAINLYFKYESYAAVINELGHPSRLALRNWIEEHKRHGDIKKEIKRRSKYTEKQQQAAVDHYLEYGKCYSRTIKMLGYPSRALLTNWVMELAPQPRQFKRNGINLTSKEKEVGVIASLTCHTSGQKISDDMVLNGSLFTSIKTSCLGQFKKRKWLKKPDDGYTWITMRNSGWCNVCLVESA